MSDTYHALLDCSADRHQARALAPTIVDVLGKNELVTRVFSEECVLGSSGFPAGPGCARAYREEAPAARLRSHGSWTLRTSGVEVHAEPWVNMFGFTVFEGAVYPRCGARRADEFLDDVGAGVDGFTTTGIVPSIACPACRASISIHEWVTEPHLGFVHLAVVIWNRPPFEDRRWMLDVPALLERELKRPLVRTRGRV